MSNASPRYSDVYKLDIVTQKSKTFFQYMSTHETQKISVSRDIYWSKVSEITLAILPWTFFTLK